MNNSITTEEIRTFIQHLPKNWLGQINSKLLIEKLEMCAHTIAYLQSQLNKIQQEKEELEREFREKTTVLVENMRLQETRNQSLLHDAQRKASLIVQEAEIKAEKIQEQAQKKAQELLSEKANLIKQLEYEHQKKLQDSYKKLALETAQHNHQLAQQRKLMYDMLMFLKEILSPIGAIHYKIKELEINLTQMPFQEDAIFLNKESIKN
ncbi:MAG: DivIVA domain-containing protein [Cytophagales bacterium]|nr:DivIVA domain-containing protein [Cytophagales bacterium]MDW8383278.1 hypothetical protein [Flammeovirgaceae bacterium]